MTNNFLRFDLDHSTLIDYFAILGFDNGQLRKLIAELMQDVSAFRADQTRLENLTRLIGSSTNYDEEEKRE